MAEKFVYFNNFNNMEDIVSSKVAEHIKTIGYTPITADGADLGSREEVDDFFREYKKNLAGAILANPPVPSMRGGIEDATDEMWKNARDIFVVPMLNITQAVGKILSENKKGSIIYLNSIHAEKPAGSAFLYTIGCAAVQALCREAALIYGAENVGCYNVMRGIVQGEETYFTSEYSPLHHNSNLRFPKERLPFANSLNELCAFLLGEGAYILNGADLQADEGFRLYYGKSDYYT
ncbi:MAG: SDR family oxidoreductase [Oscillospiraceae bacterium]|nr:SDR family oxidoreductase [Oscillospiraceae bacterium]